MRYCREKVGVKRLTFSVGGEGGYRFQGRSMLDRPFKESFKCTVIQKQS